MALQVLHGPITMSPDPEDSRITGTAGLQVGNDQRAIYLDGFDWFGNAGSGLTVDGLSSMVRVSLDGVTRLVAERPSAFGVDTMCLDDVSTYGVLASFDFDNTANLYDPTVLFERVDAPSVNAFTGGVDGYVRTRVGWLRMSGANVQLAPVDASDETEFATIYTLNPGIGASIEQGWSLGPDNIAYLYTASGANPEIVAFDYAQQTEVFPNTNGTNRWTFSQQFDYVYYSRKFGCFMAYIEDGLTADQGLLYIISTELVPNALSAPTADPAITAGVVSTISVTLTDDNSVGIPDRLIDWSITAGNGTLLDTQSTTDENGIATARYRCPITGGVNPTIQASLTY